MSEEWGHEAGAPQSAPNQGPTAGALLRQAREAAGLHVAALAVALKVPVRKLEALEDDRYDLMPDNVFVRGLASSVCRTLKIDPQPVLDRLPQRTAPRLVKDNDGINTPFRAPSDGAPPTWTDQLSKPVFLVVFALLLGALIILLLPTVQRDDTPRSADKTEIVMAPAPAPMPAPAMAQAQPPVATPAPEPAFPPKTGAAAAPTSTPTPAPATVASAPAPVPVVAVPAAAPAAASASGIVVFRAKGPTWVEVTDARGHVPVRKVLASGESTGVTGPLPLKVTIGRVDQTIVEVRGKLFDMSRVSKDNVARFEVK